MFLCRYLNVAYMYVWTCVHTYTHVYKYLCKYVYKCMYISNLYTASINQCLYAYVYNVHTYTHVYKYLFTYVYICRYISNLYVALIHQCLYAYVYTYTHICIRMCTYIRDTSTYIRVHMYVNNPEWRVDQICIVNDIYTSVRVHYSHVSTLFTYFWHRIQGGFADIYGSSANTYGSFLDV